MMGVVFSMEEIEQRLVSMSKKMQNKAIDEVLEVSSKPVIEEMDNNVPVDTEELKKSLGVIKIAGTGTKRKIHLGSTSKDRKIVERAFYQEYGNSSMLGSKWLKKSYQNTTDEVKKIVAEKIKENLMR